MGSHSAASVSIECLALILNRVGLGQLKWTGGTSSSDDQGQVMGSEMCDDVHPHANPPKRNLLYWRLFSLGHMKTLGLPCGGLFFLCHVC